MVLKRFMKHSYLLEFHIARQAREKYQFSQTIFATNGNVVFADFGAARMFAMKMNEKRDLVHHPELSIRAGQINAMGLIDEILHQLIEEYRKQKNNAVMEQAINWVNSRLDHQTVHQCLLAFTELFPPRDVYLGLMDANQYLQASSLRADGRLVPNSEIALEEMLMLWVANQNPAFRPFLELFDDADLVNNTAYSKVITGLYSFFEKQPKFGPDHQNLIDLLQAPARAHPNSLSAQLDFIRKRWGSLIPRVIQRLLSSIDMLREEEKPVFGFGGEPQSMVYEFKGPEYEFEPERFSQDLYWMPNLVLLAKNTYVWLDQLARKYQRPINRLDQVPDEELETMARWGFTGLWLIGLWERSKASQMIKQLRGNPDAVASAYSLFSYDISADLGGEDAYQSLRNKAARFGIRLASDMVPNHMGIDSRWVIEHPDWFIQLPYPPFPTYTFNGPNLSSDGRVGLFIEDHYYDNSDAAVVFKRQDFWTGDSRYIYHGNDGTSMPWNDTAQLNYLSPEVREAVIRTILHVASKFPIIRFDAAMTLAKRHYQRLWFPEPGSGGDIPSRAEFGLTKEQFDQAFPEEFWRTVVDRVAQEAPDTLLLAEAFWLMEGYFVRTLGMHRVYNSAFMNMLRDEKNQEYRLVIKNTMQFDLEILKRYVNFMNNPDERTAVDQFGKGDKYFGICTMLATLPGLPMFGHGQIEGFAEKYGMEFRYPKWHEEIDVDLVRRHEQLIFPLIRRRNLFAEAQNFRLYDFFTSEGYVNEDVFAYSNQAHGQHALVVYHNRFADANGWIHTSAAFAIKTGGGDDKTLVQTSLGEALGLHDDPNTFTIYRDFISGMEFIRPSQELIRQGMYLSLHAYHCSVFLDFREIPDDQEHSYSQLNAHLSGKGVPDIDEARQELRLRSVLTPYRELINPGMLSWLVQNRVDAESYEPKNLALALEETRQKTYAFLEALKEHQRSLAVTESLADEVKVSVQNMLTLPTLWKKGLGKSAPSDFFETLFSGIEEMTGLERGGLPVWSVLLFTIVNNKVGDLVSIENAQKISRMWFDELLLAKVDRETLQAFGLDAHSANRMLDLERVLLSNRGWFNFKAKPQDFCNSLINAWLEDDAARRYLQVHAHEDILWYNRESFLELAWWTCSFEFILLRSRLNTKEMLAQAVSDFGEIMHLLRKAMEQSGYQVEKLADSQKTPEKG